MKPAKDSTTSSARKPSAGVRKRPKPAAPSVAVRKKLKPIQRLDLVRCVAEQIREQILAGVYKSEETLPSEGKLAEAFDVSRTVIREAMRILGAQGLVETSQGKQPRVKPADSETAVSSLRLFLRRGDHALLDLLEVRRPLETAIATLAAQRATPEQIKLLRASVEKIANAQSLARGMDADIEFHKLLAEASENSVFPLLLETLAGLLLRSRQETFTHGGMERAIAGHRAILAAVEKRDPAAARRAMSNHLDKTEQDLQR